MLAAVVLPTIWLARPDNAAQAPRGAGESLQRSRASLSKQGSSALPSHVIQELRLTQALSNL